MDGKMKQKIEETVLDILNGADMEMLTEAKVRSTAAERLSLDLSVPERKRFVRTVVENFLAQQQEEEEEEEEIQQQQEGGEEHVEEAEADEEEEEEEDNNKKKRREKEYDDEGDLIICRLSTKRRVTIQDFRGKTLVSIREYYEKNGKELPTSKGISLTAEQWAAFSKAVPDIEDAIKKLESEL